MIQEKLHAIGLFISDDRAKELDASIEVQSRLMIVPVDEIEDNIVRLLTPRGTDRASSQAQRS